MAKQTAKQLSPNEQKLQEGFQIIREHPLFGKSIGYESRFSNKGELSKDTAAVVSQAGYVLFNKYADHTPKEWAYIIAHCKLHFAFGHFIDKNRPGHFIENEQGEKVWKAEFDENIWNMACDMYIAKFLNDIKFGTPPFAFNAELIRRYGSDERSIYESLIRMNVPFSQNFYGTAKQGSADMMLIKERRIYSWTRKDYLEEYVTNFAFGLADSVREVVADAGGGTDERPSVQKRAAKWFVDHYPLLGGLAANFKIIEVGYGSQAEYYRDISVAAVDCGRQEIYVNSGQKLSEEEWRFVLAHEFLHAGLEHSARCSGRDPYLWNVACDYVVNGWLVNMQVGKMPANGLLYDKEYAEYSAEEIYDILTDDVKRAKRLETFAGEGKCDIADSGYESSKGYVTLDEFCRNALRNGLDYHLSEGRGFIPAGLIEEIKALSVPPVPWDVRLAEWFDNHFEPIERHRTYARVSRRQASTPDIPRPAYVTEVKPVISRTFGVIIDTSGSMSPKLLGLALGAVASYSIAREVPSIRLIFCDAAAYDEGYVSPEDIAGRVRVVGRGGTVIQPAVDLLERAEDFPPDGPILIITDGYIEDHLNIHRDHAYLVPKGRHLPFRTRGEIFYFDEK